LKKLPKVTEHAILHGKVAEHIPTGGNVQPLPAFRKKMLACMWLILQHINTDYLLNQLLEFTKEKSN